MIHPLLIGTRTITRLARIFHNVSYLAFRMYSAARWSTGTPACDSSIGTQARVPVLHFADRGNGNNKWEMSGLARDWRSTLILAASWLWLAAPAAPGNELTFNLVHDGGIEQWEEVFPTDPGWNTLNFSWKSWQFSKTEKGGMLRPVFLNQPTDYQYQGILRREDRDVHGGKHALRIKGEFYLNGRDGEGSYRTAEGDIFIIRYWAKGKGETEIRLHVYGEGRSVMLEKKGAPQKDQWTLIEQRCVILGQAPTSINPRIWASEEMLIDDIFIGRGLRDKERVGKSVPEDCGERVVFSTSASKPPVIDGKLDDEGWRKTVAFSGFRGYTEQTALVSLQTQFRVLYDESALYIGMEIMQPNAAPALEELSKASLLDGKGVPQDKQADVYTARHSVELFLQPPGGGKYFQYVASLDGYRYDGMGQDGKWNSGWTFAVTAGEDRWFLEMRIPGKEMGVERIARGAEWGLNVVCNKEMNYSTWSAVGGNFHNPAGFGKLMTMEFREWCEAKTTSWDAVKRSLLEDDKGLDSGLEERLRRTEAFGRSLGMGKEATAMDWKTMTRRYGDLAFLDTSYRTMQEEIRYKRFFQPRR